MRVIQKSLVVFLLPLLLCGSRTSARVGVAELSVASYAMDAGRGDVGLYNSVAQDRFGGIHISFYDIETGSLKYAYTPSIEIGYFKTEMVDNEGDTGWWTNIMVDAEGIPHIIYVQRTVGDETRFVIKHAAKEGKEWDINKLSHGLDYLRGFYPSAVMDTKGNIHIAWVDTDLKLYYAIFDGEKVVHSGLVDWALESREFQGSGVPGGGALGLCVSLALDVGERPHVGYYDAENANLKYAVKTEEGWDIYTVGWERVEGEELLFECAVGRCTARLNHPSSMVRSHTKIVTLSPTGAKVLPDDPNVWYYKNGREIVLDDDYFSSNMQYIISYTRTDTSPEDDGMYCSLALDSLEMPNIAYYDASKFSLGFARFDGERWTREIVDEGGVGTGISLLMAYYEGRTDRKFPVIAYMDFRRWNLKIAAKPDEEWIIRNALGGGAAGAHPSSIFLPEIWSIGVSYVKMSERTGLFSLKFASIPLP